jgi:predicted ATP-grasp superfamily ATP-dependent carboligase
MPNPTRPFTAEKRLRILLSEGSSLSARETVTALGLSGHAVEIVSSDLGCLSRFSRFVTRVHPAPPSGRDPEAYLEAVLQAVGRGSIDVLLPTHEQAYLFAAARGRLPPHLGVALAEFSAFEQVQSKSSLSELLERLGVPQPATRIVLSADEMACERGYPYFVKTAFGTASAAVWRIGNDYERTDLARGLDRLGAFREGVVVQAAADGKLERCQAVFDHGRRVAWHAYRQIAEGPGGGDVIKQSVRRPEARSWVEKIGSALGWHGALSFDYILDAASGAPLFIDANPRLVEPMNAWFSGIDLAGALLGVSLGRQPETQPDGQEGVVTRLGLMALMDAARRRGRRLDVLREMVQIASGARRYRGSIEELVPVGSDVFCLAPLGMVLAKLLASPASGTAMSRSAVKSYSLTPCAMDRIRAWFPCPVTRVPESLTT